MVDALTRVLHYCIPQLNSAELRGDPMESIRQAVDAPELGVLAQRSAAATRHSAVARLSKLMSSS